MIDEKLFRSTLRQCVDSLLGSLNNKSYTVHHINNGYCADLAHIVWESFGRSNEIEIYSDEELGADDYTHTFIKFNDLYYDAECLDGEEDWTQLPIFHDPDRIVKW